jgi:hypothetical protein
MSFRNQASRLRPILGADIRNAVSFSDELKETIAEYIIVMWSLDFKRKQQTAAIGAKHDLVRPMPTQCDTHAMWAIHRGDVRG